MADNYRFYTSRAEATPQTAPIPLREREMTQMGSGGYAFDAGLWEMLRRCLLIGTTRPTYYAGRQELTDDFVATVRQAVQEDPERTAEEIVYASDGRAITNSAPILALVLLSMGDSPEANAAFRQAFSQVIRTAAHLYEFISYARSLRGRGQLIQDTGNAWLREADPRWLAYQLLKYPQRHGISRRDVLRLHRVKPPTPEHDQLFNWVVNGWDGLPERDRVPDALDQIWWFEWLKRNPDRTVEAIREGRLTHEVATLAGRIDRDAWQAIFEGMPMTALLRNVGSLTEIGVLRADEPANLDRVEERLTDVEALKEARIHPLHALIALKTYQSGGQLGLGRKTWDPVGRVVDVLERTVTLAFEAIEPTGQVFVHALDVSGSMSSPVNERVNLARCEVASTMALVTAKAETNYLIRGFAGPESGFGGPMAMPNFKDLGISAQDTPSSAATKAVLRNFGATDASIAWDWLTQKGFKADVVCFWTDGESWAGQRHPSQALAEYRQTVNPDVKAVYINLTPRGHSLADPKDPQSWALGGFDPGLPRIIQMIANGEL